jgi:hypothetical protein
MQSEPWVLLAMVPAVGMVLVGTMAIPLVNCPLSQFFLLYQTEKTPQTANPQLK